ncbi:hypothetical protein [Tropicibacter naphthalenivorans]|uniref:Uncharacterized protein n=1 Tax=Tropicibacter naphthalenivorans TaxID=441103 RepID=A0A0P1H1N7_9RHOB|nr:hypothetical protein [Tropicibacter naphthalenivorans]CUH82090.1 hypothetical protein TRN7648_03809 [Tropicibacter naphthalenivorans]SMD08505.1 hypothetical protein SAMN04488093_11734 [Tropicibacter naphthalenivorans]
MFIELIAVFIAGFAGAGVMMLLAKITGGRLPKWLVPLGAGAAMLATGISNEYTWYSRTAAALPEGVTVAQSIESRALWRPWTYVFPMTDRFVAADTAALRPNADTAGLYLTTLYFFGHWRPTQSVEVMVDCTAMRRADPALGDGSPPVWRDVGADDPVVKTVCEAV